MSRDELSTEASGVPVASLPLHFIIISSHLPTLPSSLNLLLPFFQCVEIVTASICHYLSDPKSRNVYASKEIAAIVMSVITSNPPVSTIHFHYFSLLMVVIFITIFLLLKN